MYDIYCSVDEDNVIIGQKRGSSAIWLFLADSGKCYYQIDNGESSVFLVHELINNKV